MIKDFVEPKLIPQEDMDAIAGSLDALRALSIRTPKPAQQVHMENRLADYLELVEQDYLRGWTDCEQGMRHSAKQSQAYDNGYGDYYEYENQSNGYGEDMG